MPNLIEGLIEQMNRCRELIKMAEEIGPPGAFAKCVYESAIKNAEKAMAGGDVIEMAQAYKQLENCE
jgi:hypothetical protein